MNITRTKELNYLKQYYEKNGSQLLVVYGQEYVGKTTLLKEFVKDKPFLYYEARYVSNPEQLKIMASELELSAEKQNVSSYLDIFHQAGSQETSRKMVVIIDEFHKMIKQGTDGFTDIVSYMKEEGSRDILFILCSSSIAFVENSLVAKVGRNALSIHGFYKVKEVPFTDVRAAFANYPIEDCIKVYSLFGGVPGLYGHFDKTLSFKENVIHNILEDGSFLREEGRRQVAKELRETAVYHTILSQLADGHFKLNELHANTGFSRAKISVYLKNLMELEFVDKIFSVDTQGRENAQKGIYQIKNHYIHFWFAFIWKNLSRLQMMDAEAFYDKFIEPYLPEFCTTYYSKICTEYMELKNQQNLLPVHYTKSGRWVGKTGNIDMLAMDDNDHKIACFCHYGNKLMNCEDYEGDLLQLAQAKVKADFIYLFTNSGFDENMLAKANSDKQIVLIDKNMQ